jgi:uncharacterized protein involved in outer membrane biogenesis
VKLPVVLAVIAIALVLIVVFFPWDMLRGPVNRYVSEKTGRQFAITRHLDVKVGRTTRILLDGLQFANPGWAKDPYLVQAEGGEIHVNLLPLLHRRIELPLVQLNKPQLGLQLEPDGRRSWALGADTGDKRNIPQIGALVVDAGSVHFIAREHGADIHTDFAIRGPLMGTNVPAQTAQNAAQMPLTFSSRGVWQKAQFTAQGATGNAMYLSEPLAHPFPIDIRAAAGETTIHATGAVSSLATLDGAKVDVNMRGHDLADLYKFLGVVLPSTPRYTLRADLTKEGEVWHARNIRGKLGNSDLSGELEFDRGQPKPLLTGSVRSKSLDFDDLAPLVGLPEQPRSAAAVPEVKGQRQAPAQVQAAKADPNRRVLPVAKLDVPRLKAMDADVNYDAAQIVHARGIPLERMKVHVVMKGGVLQLDPLDVGIAGGSFAGGVRIDGNVEPTLTQVHLKARDLELNKIFGGMKLTKATFGKIHGDVNLRGRGDSVAQMLASSGGQVAMLMGGGEISNLLLEFAGLDGGEIIKFLIKGDQNVELRCGAAAWDVNNGVMQTRALVLDTTDTVIYGDGQVSLADEQFGLTLRPYPKDMSILAFRSPLKVGGHFARPKLGVDKGALASKGAVVLALGAINPLLGLAATIETGPGKDKGANCGPVLRNAVSPYEAAKVAVMSKPASPAKEAVPLKDNPAVANAPLEAQATARLGNAAAARNEPGGRKSPAPAKPPAARPNEDPTLAPERPHAPGAPGRLYGD